MTPASLKGMESREVTPEGQLQRKVPKGTNTNNQRPSSQDSRRHLRAQTELPGPYLAEAEHHGKHKSGTS